jgi:hypothetical protein
VIVSCEQETRVSAYFNGGIWILQKLFQYQFNSPGEIIALHYLCLWHSAMNFTVEKSGQ